MLVVARIAVVVVTGAGVVASSHTTQAEVSALAEVVGVVVLGAMTEVVAVVIVEVIVVARWAWSSVRCSMQ